MSRHRDVRAMAAEDYYDGGDDYYDDGYEFAGDDSLGADAQAKLDACVAAVKDVVGDSVTEAEIIDTCYYYSYNTEYSLAWLLDGIDKLAKPTPSSRQGGGAGSKGRSKGKPEPGHSNKAQQPSTSKSAAHNSGGAGGGRSVKGGTTAATPEGNKGAKTKGGRSGGGGAMLTEKMAAVSLKTPPHHATTTTTTTHNNNKKTSTPAGLGASPLGSASKKKKIDVVGEVAKRNNGRTPVSVTFVGHVDAGKSTLMGHLLYLVGVVGDREVARCKHEATKIGKGSFALAWLLDATPEERQRGVTIGIGRQYIQTKTRDITLLDAPGHRDFIPNMITGAAEADCALLVVDASKGNFEAGMNTHGQTKEHTMLIRALGITEIIVAVNKMDQVSWDKERYHSIVATLTTFFKQWGFSSKSVTFLPISGLKGENVATRGDGAPWYTGPCLVEVLDQFRVPERALKSPFRCIVNDVFKPNGGGWTVVGKVTSGHVQNGDEVMVLPTGELYHAKAVAGEGEGGTGWAAAGDSVTMTLVHADSQEVPMASVLCDVDRPLRVGTRMRVRIMVFDVPTTITQGFQVELHIGTITTAAHVGKLYALVDSAGVETQPRPRFVSKKQAAVVKIKSATPIAMETYAENKTFGRVLLRAEGKTVAAGIIQEVLG